MAADDYHIIAKHGKTTTASAVSPNSIKKPKERVPATPDMPEVNLYLMCQLCSGYLIDATAIIECQHTFCKSCILKYLETNSYCPICDVQLNKADPQYSLRSDIIIQRLVYKLVPGLFVSESKRRRDFYVKNDMEPVAAAEAANSLAVEIEAASDMSTVLSLDDVVSLSIEYFRSDDKTSPTPSPGSTKPTDANGKQQQSTTAPSSATQSCQNQQQKSNVKSFSVNNSSGGTSISDTNANAASSTDNNGSDNGNTSEQANDRRYLQCPAGVSVGLLKKFIRRKYGLSDDYRVDLLYNGNRDSILESDLTLLDVAFIYKWNKDDPMKFQYRIFERPPKSMTIYSGMKRPANSMMDEPPDDDTASGPHNGSSMFSSSSAPSSKLPRLGDNTANTTTQGNQGNVPKDSTSGKSTATSTDPAPTSAAGTVSCKTSASSSAHTAIKVEKEEVDEDDDDEDDEEDYELVERKEHMKGIKSSRKNSIKESMKRSVAASNLRSHISRSSSSHSTDTKDSVDSERESGNENSLNSSNSGSKRNTNANVAKKRANSYEAKPTGRPRGRPPKHVDSLRLRVTSSDNSRTEPQSTGSLKMSISTSGITPVVSSSPGEEKKDPIKLSLGTVLAKKGSKSPERKHHKRKHHHHHKLRHRDKQSKGLSSASSSPPTNQKPMKLIFTLSPPGTATVQQTQGNQSQNSKSATLIKPSQDTETKEQKGKPLAGTQQNYNNSARTSASAHGHLNNISKSISVSINTNVNSTSGASVSNNANKGGQHGNKILSPAELIPKNTGMEIQPTTIPISSSSHGQNSQHSMQHQNSSNVPSNNSNNSHKHSHPLLPDSVHVPKSVTLIPVNPNTMNLNSSNSVGGGGSSLEKGGSGSHHGNQNRINSHTFTHPITNKSLHQITVTEVPPPQKTSGGMGNSSLGNHNNTGMGNSSGNSTLHSSISGTTSNPIEKVIANAANNKPQFNGPGSMEITKINCWTTTSKENPAKKLKDRRGLDISITGTGINVNLNKSAQKLEETLRQKVNIATGGGSGSISVTPVAPPNSLGSGNYCNNVITTSSAGGSNMNKMKSVSATAASLLSGKMPPGITIGPATVPQNSSNNGNNPANNNINNNSGGGSGSASVGNNIMKGLGFTLPPHLTAHPHNPNNMKTLSNQGKSDKIQTNAIHTNNSRLLGKDSVSIIGKGGAGIAGGQQHQPPPPVEITISATGGNKSQTNITNRGINIVNNSKINNDPLASIFDITQGLRKSPTPAVNNHAKDNNSKQQNSIPAPNATQGGGNVGGSSSMNTKNMANKRPYDMSASGSAVQTGNKKVTKETSEMKRARSASTSSEPGTATKQSGKPEGEIPLDLSGRSTRTTPPITIPHREPSKSPTATTTSAVPNENKRAQAKSSEAEKSGKVISPSSSASSGSALSKNFLSPKMNTQKNSAVEPFNKGQQPNKSISVSKLSPNQASKIGSIVDSLAQKQAQAQAQQHLQNVKNSQIQQQQQQHRSQSHHHSSNVTSNPNNSTHSNNNANNSGGMPNLKTSQSNSNSNSNNAGKPSSITSPIPASSSMTSPVMPMTSPSPPGTDHMRNLWTLSDTAVRQGKLNSMNELLAAASLFSPPGHPHSLAGAAAAHQLAAAAAAASPSGAFNSNIMAQFGHHLAALGANKIPPGMFDHHFMAAAMNAHNAHAAASGMRMAHPFAGSMSPPLNAFYPHGSPAGQQQQQSPIPGAALGQKVQNPPSANKSGICGTGKQNSIPFAPLFSHSVPVSSPKSPNSGNLSASSGPPSVKTPTTCNSIPPPVLPFSSPVTNSGMSNHLGSSATNKDQKPPHSLSGKGSSSLPSSGSGVGGKSTKINGTMSTAMPVFPPGIHNPLLQPRSSTNSNSSNSSGNCFQSGSSTGASSKTFSTVAALSNKSASKGGIPNSMKISNFLPSKPKDPASNANTEATITSGSNFGIPPLQSKPNFSLSHSRSPSDSLSLTNSMNISKSPSFKEGPLSPVKSVASGGTVGATISPTNKPSSLTCASLLLPDSMYSKPSTHHLLNSLSPTKGDHGNLGLCRSNRTPSSDSVLLSPNSSPSHKTNIRTTSPGASSYAFPKPGSRSEDSKPHRTISPTKDESSSKKEKGGIPMGASLVRNFPPSTTSSISQLTHNAPCLSLTRPIPTIPAFFNRSCNSNTSTSMSSNTNSNISHHHQQHKNPLPGRMPTSPVKMNNDQQQHLASPVCPFPGVSVPVQVKLQDDSEVASVKVAPDTPITTTSITTPPTHSISLKSEVNKVMTAKEGKVQEKRKRSISPPSTPGDSKLGAGDSKPTQLKSELVAPCKTTLGRENSIEISPAKVQKIEIQATAPSTVKNELEKQERLIISESKCNSKPSESVNNAGSSIKAESIERKENESQSSQRESGKGGEQGEERKSEREGADPSTQFSSASNSLHGESQGPCKVEAEISSPVKAVETLGVEAALSQMQTVLTKPEKEECVVISVEEEKSETQIVVDTECPESDEIKSEVKHQESKTFEIPEEKQDEKIISIVAAEGEKTEDNAEEDIDIEMVNEKEEEVSPLKQCEIHAELEMDIVEDNQMEIDVEANEEKMDDAEGKVVTEERLILTKEDDDDLDVDILDVGVDEPMEVTTDGIINSTENEHMEEEATEGVDEAEKMCIHNEESIPAIPAISNHDHDNESNLEIIEFTENPSAGLDNDNVEENEMSESKSTEEDAESGEDLTKQEKIEKEAVEEQESEPTNDCEQDSIFLPENESTTFSQDDSECGDLIIDLGPNDEEDTEEQKDNKVEETDDLDQAVSVAAEPSQEENISSQESQVILKEVSANEESCSLETLTKNEIALNEPSSTFPINSQDETVEEQAEEKSELSEGKEESIPSAENSSIESTKVVLANVEPLNQDSILNQITINPTPIEVNGVIKTDMESEEREEREEIPLSPPSVVSECPQPALDSANEQGAEEKNEETSNSEQAMVEEPELELSGNAELDLQEENEITDSIDSSVKASETAEVSTDSAQLDQVGSPSTENVVFPLDNDNKNIADKEEEMLVEDKCNNIEEEISTISTIPAEPEEQGTISLEILTSNENICKVPIQEDITPIQFTEKDNNITDIEAISVSNDIMEQETASSVVVTGEEDMEGTPMETEQTDGQEATTSSDVQMISPEAPSSLDSPTIVPNVDDVSMQIETDSVLPTDDSSTCVPTESNIADESATPANELAQQDSPIDTQPEQSNDEAASAQQDSTPSPVPTPTSSTSSVAIKLDISASNEGEGELNGGGNSAESLSPPSKITTTSSSLIIPANTSGSSSSGLKSLESFGKVAAGLLASATSTINNNNNNTSLAPTSCDAISIVTTNANA